MLDPNRWTLLWRSLGADRADLALCRELQWRYAEPWRAYHTATHIVECLSEFDDVRAHCERPDEVELALWFHDAIYDTRRSDNEARSAEWAMAALAAGGIAMPVRQRIAELIMATNHQPAPQTGDQALLVDIDLAIFGQSAQRFDLYEQQIRREYQWVPELIFHQRRGAILQRFLDRPRLYHTDTLFNRYETEARINLQRSIERLRTT
jgi:predicted metal-dependent HD superfamily phosphohydrolase